MLDESFFRGRRLAVVGSICRDVKMGAIRPGPYLLEDGETPTAFIVETVGGGGANGAGRGRAGGRRAILRQGRRGFARSAAPARWSVAASRRSFAVIRRWPPAIRSS